jgi:hypothetical protein
MKMPGKDSSHPLGMTIRNASVISNEVRDLSLSVVAPIYRRGQDDDLRGDISETQKKMILGENVKRFFGL